MTMHTLQIRTDEGQSSASSMHRRNFIRLATGAVATSAFWTPLAAQAATKLEPLPRGIKVSLQISTDATDEDLQFAQQLGVGYVNIPTGGNRANLENFIRLKKKVEDAGLKVDTCQDRGGACARLTAGPLTRPHFRLGSSGRSA